MHNAHIGDVLDIPDGQAEFLIKAGIAEPYTEPKQTKKPASKKSE